MARCSRCGRDNVAGAKVCAACHSALPEPPPTTRAYSVAPPLTVRCPSCNRPVPQTSRFCSACGAPLMPTPGPTPPPTPRARVRISALGADSSVAATWPIIKAETTVGTAGEIRLTEPQIEPHLGRFLLRDGAVRFVPERVLNGTFLLLRRERALPIGGELRIGRQVLRLEPMPPQPVSTERLWGSANPGYRFRVQQILTGGMEGDAFPLREGENLIARVSGDISFPGDGYVSGKHATLTVRGDHVLIKDLGSSNGTFIRMDVETPLTTGDLLLTGEQLLRVDPA